MVVEIASTKRDYWRWECACLPLFIDCLGTLLDLFCAIISCYLCLLNIFPVQFSVFLHIMFWIHVIGFTHLSDLNLCILLFKQGSLSVVCDHSSSYAVGSVLFGD